MNPGLIVVGSGPAGVSAAAAFRKHNKQLPVQIVTDDPAEPYARPPLSKEYLRAQSDEVTMHDPKWFAERAIEVLHIGPVNRIDTSARTIGVGEKTLPYGSLVLACGSAPNSLPVPGGERALKLRSLADAARLREEAADARTAVVVGAGFIGCEAAASLTMRGVTTTLVAPDPVPQSKRLGSDAGARLRAMLDAVGVRYVGGASVTSIDDEAIHLDNDVAVSADLILAATGVTPRSGIAASAGLHTEDQRIVVGADMRTDAKDIYAAGDVALAFNVAVSRRLPVEHWQDAHDQGAIAGENAAGASLKWDAVPGFWTSIGDTTLKYHAWGDGYEHSRFDDHGDGFTVWYEARGVAVGVLTHNRDDDYERAGELIAAARPVPR